MAEVVGLVVGLASFGVQLLEGTSKLKALCRMIEDAPTELRDTIEGIEIMSEIVSMMAPSSSQQPAESAVLTRSMDLCQKALDKLAVLTDDLQQRFRSNKARGVLSVGLRRDSMTGLITRLEQCKGLLQLSHQLYMGAHNMSRFDRQDRTLDELRRGQMTLVARSLTRFDRGAGVLDRLQSGQKTDAENSKHNLTGRCGERETISLCTGAKLKARTIAIRLAIPGWSISRVLELTVAPVTAGWTASLRCYRVLHDEDSVFAACKKDDLVTLQRLFEDQRVGIYDRDQWGCSLFEVAMIAGAVDICKFLYVQGGRILPEHNEEMVVYFFWESYLVAAPSTPRHNEGSMLVELRHCCTRDLAQMGFERSDSIFHEARSIQCWLFWISYIVIGNINIGEILQDMVGKAPIDPAFLDPSISGGKSLLHVFAVSHACLLCYCNFEIPENEATFAYAVSCITQYIASGADAHSRGSWVHSWYDNMTPMAVFVNSIMALSGTCLDEALLDKALRSWAHLLKCSGMDLLEYGQGESATRCEYFNYWVPSAQILGFSYTAVAEDWHFWFLEPTDDYAGTFWALVEHSEKHMPGAWVEDENEATVLALNSL